MAIDRAAFYRNPEVIGFIDWLCSNVDALVVDIAIKGSSSVPGGVSGTAVGLDAVLAMYRWNAKWSDSAGDVPSSDWESTVASLNKLGALLRAALNTPCDEAAFLACCRIFEWGGDRNPLKGAVPFLRSKVSQDNGLCAYLNQVRAAVKLASADLSELSAVQRMNSMLTKVHSLASEDGLPIYDSRVAAATACLVEIYRHNSGLSWDVIPELLIFPATEMGRRHVGALQRDQASTPSPGAIRYTQHHSKNAARWMSASIRLGWIIEEVLFRRPDLLKQHGSRMHAFEACLFMMGYDVKCLRGNLNP